jgi:hypothetical protein
MHNNRSTDSGGVTSAGGLAAIAIKMFGVKNSADNHPILTLPELLRKKTKQGNASRMQRRNQDEHDGETADSVAREMA